MNKEKSIISKSNTEIFSKIREHLPANYLKMVHERINESISIRQIRYIISGFQNDYHNVMDALIDIATEEKKRREAVAERLKNLQK